MVVASGQNWKMKKVIKNGARNISVSYTHLDVYKRQLYRSGNFDAYPRFADELKNLAFALAQVRKQADAKCLKYAQD